MLQSDAACPINFIEKAFNEFLFYNNLTIFWTEYIDQIQAHLSVTQIQLQKNVRDISATDG